MRISPEAFFYGLITLASGLSQLIDFWIFPNLFKLYAGLSLLAIGALVVLAGLFWRWGPWQRPLGVTLLAISYSLIGLIVLFLGGFLLTILFLFAFVFFLIAWALFKGKTWGRIAVYVMTGIGLLLSFIGVNNGGIIFIPGVLGSGYIFWYLNRRHVAEYFGAEALWDIGISRKALVFPLVLLFILIPFLVNLYISPPTSIIFSDKLKGWSTGPGGGSGWYFFAKRGDLLAYSFEVDADSAPIHFYIESSEYPKVLLISSEGRSGSGLVEIPYASQWEMWTISQGTYMSVQVNMSVTQFSLRVPIVQWMLLNLYVIALLFSFVLTSNRVVLSFFV